MKPIVILVLLTFFLISCSSAPSANAIQTAIAETQAAQPVQPSQMSSPAASEPTKNSALEIIPTSTVTLIPPPTATLKPTKIPASPTPSLPALEILSSQSYVDYGWLHIVGEVQNNSNTPMEFVKIVATLYDDGGKITGTDFTYTELDVIPPGGKSPFETGTDNYEGTTNYKLQVQGDKGTLGRQDLVISGDSSYEEYGWLHIRGEVKNTGSVAAQYVKIIATLYDADGNVVSMDFTYTELDTILPGESSPFETGTDHYPNFDQYELQVQGVDAE
jgi:hypothetical protein